MDHEISDILCPPFSLEIKTSQLAGELLFHKNQACFLGSSGPFNLDRWMTGAAGILNSCVVTMEEKL
jgi:hypothetical protein